MLPILTFDEARLSPSHGYIFNRGWLCSHETILGIAWKLARINALGSVRNSVCEAVF